MKTLWKYLCENYIFEKYTDLKLNRNFRSNLFDLLTQETASAKIKKFVKDFNIRRNNKNIVKKFFHPKDLFYIDKENISLEDINTIIQNLNSILPNSITCEAIGEFKNYGYINGTSSFDSLKVLFKNNKGDTLLYYIVNPKGTRKGILNPKDILKEKNIFNDKNTLYNDLVAGIKNLSCKELLKNEALLLLNEINKKENNLSETIEWCDFIKKDNYKFNINDISIGKELLREFSECLIPVILFNKFGEQITKVIFPKSSIHGVSDVFINGIEFSVKSGENAHAAAIRNMLLKHNNNVWIPKLQKACFNNSETDEFYRFLLKIFFHKNINSIVQLHSIILRHILNSSKIKNVNNLFTELKNITDNENKKIDISKINKLFSFSSYKDLKDNLFNLYKSLPELLCKFYQKIYTFNDNRFQKNLSNKKEYFLYFKTTEYNKDVLEYFNDWLNKVSGLDDTIIYGTLIYPLWVEAIKVLNNNYLLQLTEILNLLTNFKTVHFYNEENGLNIKISSSKKDNWLFKAVASISNPTKLGLSVEIIK